MIKPITIVRLVENGRITWFKERELKNTMTYKHIDLEPKLKNEIDPYVQEVVNQKVKEIARTAAENACKEYFGDYLAEQVAAEVEKIETGRLEEVFAELLKRYGLISRVNESVNFESVKSFLDYHSKLFDEHDYVTTDYAYEIYCEDCEDNDETPVHKKTFSKELKKLAGIKTKVKSIDGKSVRIYTR